MGLVRKLYRDFRFGRENHLDYDIFQNTPENQIGADLIDRMNMHYRRYEVIQDSQSFCADLTYAIGYFSKPRWIYKGIKELTIETIYIFREFND